MSATESSCQAIKVCGRPQTPDTTGGYLDLGQSDETLLVGHSVHHVMQHGGEKNMARKLIDLVYFQYKSTMLSAHNQDQEWTNTMTLYKEVQVIRPSKFWALAVILIVLEQLILGIK